MKNENASAVKVKYSIDKKSFFGHSAVLMLAMAAVFQFIGCWGYWNDMFSFVMQALLPIASCVLMVLCISFLGKKGFFLSILPMIVAVVFLVYRSFGFESRIQMVLCILLYLAGAVIYAGTVTGSIHTKWLLPPLFALPFIYQVVLIDLPALANTAEPVTFAAGMQEMSLLCILAGMFCLGMGLKKKVIPLETTIVAEPALPEEELPAEPVTEPVAVEAETPVEETAPAEAPAEEAVSESAEENCDTENTMIAETADEK